MLKEFKEFALRGNMVDLAVALVIGVAFGRVITSLVDDILMPPLGLLIGDINFQDRFISLTGTDYKSLAEAKAAGAPTLNYGLFFNTLLTFILIAFAVFLIVRHINRLRSEPKPATATSRDCPYCLSSIPKKATRCPQCTATVDVAA